MGTFEPWAVREDGQNPAASSIPNLNWSLGESDIGNTLGSVEWIKRMCVDSEIRQTMEMPLNTIYLFP